MTEYPHDTEERAQARRVALIRAAIVRASGRAVGVTGIIACPACEDGEVAYAVTGGACILATCSTPGCCGGRLE